MFSVEARSSSRNGARRGASDGAPPLFVATQSPVVARVVSSRRSLLPHSQRATLKLQWALSPTLRLGDVQVYGFSRGADAFYGPVTDSRALFCF